jgi:hypothetical protein
VLLALAAVAAGVGAARLAAHRDFAPYQTANWPLALLVGWSFVGSGLVAWRQRPRNRLGSVMVFTGFAWFATFLTDARGSWLFTVGTAVQSVYLVGFVFIVLSFPAGRLQGRLDRLVILSAVGLVGVVEVVSLFFSDSQAVLCSNCPSKGSNRYATENEIATLPRNTSAARLHASTAVRAPVVAEVNSRRIRSRRPPITWFVVSATAVKIPPMPPDSSRIALNPNVK